MEERLKQGKRQADIRMRRELEKLDEPIKADGWLNLYFLKSGKVFKGTVIHPTEQDAERLARKWEATLAGKNGWFKDPWNVPVSQYSHFIPVPVKP
jgi:hypothetical protein